VAALLLLVIAVGMGERRSKDPAWVFEQEFLTPPPREVTGLRGHATEMNNGRFAYLRFSAPPEVIDSLISDWMAPASPSDLSRTDHPPDPVGSPDGSTSQVLPRHASQEDVRRMR